MIEMPTERWSQRRQLAGDICSKSNPTCLHWNMNAWCTCGDGSFELLVSRGAPASVESTAALGGQGVPENYGAAVICYHKAAVTGPCRVPSPTLPFIVCRVGELGSGRQRDRLIIRMLGLTCSAVVGEPSSGSAPNF